MCLPGASIRANSLAHANTLAEFVKREIGIFFEIRKGWLQGRAGLTSQRMPCNPAILAIPAIMAIARSAGLLHRNVCTLRLFAREMGDAFVQQAAQTFQKFNSRIAEMVPCSFRPAAFKQ